MAAGAARRAGAAVLLAALASASWLTASAPYPSVLQALAGINK